MAALLISRFKPKPSSFPSTIFAASVIAEGFEISVVEENRV